MFDLDPRFYGVYECDKYMIFIDGEDEYVYREEMDDWDWEEWLDGENESTGSASPTR